MLDYLTALAVAIKSRRRNLGLTQDQTAEKAGIASRTILDIENGNDNPRLSTLFGIVRTFVALRTSCENLSHNLQKRKSV